MGKKDVDLYLKIQYPQGAREFIDNFDWSPCDKPDHVFLNIDKSIPLDTAKMTDQEAIQAAIVIMRDVYIPSVKREKNLEMWEH